MQKTPRIIAQYRFTPGDQLPMISRASHTHVREGRKGLRTRLGTPVLQNIYIETRAGVSCSSDPHGRGHGLCLAKETGKQSMYLVEIVVGAEFGKSLGRQLLLLGTDLV